MSIDRISLSDSDREFLDELQRGAFHYFLDHTSSANGLVADSTWEGSPCSIASAGFGLAAHTVAVERGYLSRDDALERAVLMLRFFAGSHQGPEPDATGYQGFYYHFLDMQSGRRTWECELSTIDTAILVAGMLAAAEYFDGEGAGDREVRKLADELYRRVDWVWAQNGESLVRHGWRPESGFLANRWQGYDEALLLYVLGLGAPDHTLAASSYPGYTSTYRWEEHYGYQLVHAAPLFIHHFPHVWIDFRNVQDEYMRARGSDYFENSRKATYVHQQHAIRNPGGFTGYGENAWGITASEGPVPGYEPKEVDGRRFYGYLARGVPGPDDGTLSPWTAITSLPFAPEIAMPAIRHFVATYPQLAGDCGLKCSLNPSYPGDSPDAPGWFSQHYYGINEGPIVLMVENYRSGLPWRLARGNRALQAGLRRAGFTGGWLDKA